MAKREPHGGHRDEEEGGEGGTGLDQAVDAVRGVGGEIEGGEAHGGGALGGDAIRALEVASGGEDEAEPDEHAETDPAGGPHPVPLERIAEEESDPEAQHQKKPEGRITDFHYVLAHEKQGRRRKR